MIQPDLKRPLLFCLAVHLMYALVAMVFKQVLLVDSYGYLMQADNLKQYGSWYAEQWDAPVLIDYFSIRPPFYAAVLALFSHLPLGWVWMLVVQNGLSILNCMVVYRFAINIGGKQKEVKWLGAMALVLYPAQCIHANFVMTELIFQSLLLVLIIVVWRFLQSPSFALSLTVAVILSICLLTKPVSLFLPWLALAALGYGLYTHQRSVKLLLPMLWVALVFHLICLQNKHATGFYHYSSIKYINQLKYNARFALADAKGETESDRVVAEVVKQANLCDNYSDRLACFDSAATTIIKSYPLSFAKVYAKGILAFFVDPGRFEVYHFFHLQNRPQDGLLQQVQAKGVGKLIHFVQRVPWPVLMILLLNLCWNVFVLLCFVLCMFRVTVSLRLRVILAGLVFYIAVATGPVGVSRYRVPVAPQLVLAAMLLVSDPPKLFGNKKNA